MTALRRGLVLVAAILLAVAAALAGAAPARAATGDTITSYRVDYQVQADGSVRATETIDYDFARSSRGIYRTFVVREPYGDTDSDAVYSYSDISVSSPTGASTEISRSTDGSGRLRDLKLRIGSENRYVSSTETYVISYTVKGALRSSPGYAELYWDVTGFDWDASIDEVAVTVSAPGGVSDTTCFQGRPGSTQTCDGSLSGGRASYSASDLSSGEGMTIGAKLDASAVANAEPDLQSRGDQLSAGQKTLIGAGVVGAVLSAIASFFVGRGWWRRHGRDDRFAGPPGSLPPAGDPGTVIASAPPIEVPVFFTPPQIPVGEAGILYDGVSGTDETTATLIDLAVRGAIAIEEQSKKNTYAVRLLAPEVAAAPHEVTLLTKLFKGAGPGAVKELDGRGTMTAAHDAVVADLRSQVSQRGWFHRMPGAAGMGCLGALLPIGIVVGLIAIFGSGASGSGALVLLVIGLVVAPIVIAVAILASRSTQGRRTAPGRALADQVEGFRTYLATAEADQIRFEEGEDVFSRYLPWAVVFNLTERWSRICRQLVESGRMADSTPSWYHGTATGIYYINVGSMVNSFGTAATPVPSSSGSGTGFGGGSSFSGGGFSGGGGGGGGGGSW